MRGAFEDQDGLFSYISPEARIPASHPLRKIRELVREVLGELNRSLGKLYPSEGRPSIPPEQFVTMFFVSPKILKTSHNRFDRSSVGHSAVALMSKA